MIEGSPNTYSDIDRPTHSLNRSSLVTRRTGIVIVLSIILAACLVRGGGRWFQPNSNAVQFVQITSGKVLKQPLSKGWVRCTPNSGMSTDSKMVNVGEMISPQCADGHGRCVLCYKLMRTFPVATE